MRTPKEVRLQCARQKFERLVITLKGDDTDTGGVIARNAPTTGRCGNGDLACRPCDKTAR